jgi:hypothetical protein
MIQDTSYGKISPVRMCMHVVQFFDTLIIYQQKDEGAQKLGMLHGLVIVGWL